MGLVEVGVVGGAVEVEGGTYRWEEERWGRKRWGKRQWRWEKDVEVGKGSLEVGEGYRGGRRSQWRWGRDGGRVSGGREQVTVKGDECLRKK